MVEVRDTYLGAKGGRYIYVLKPTKSTCFFYCLLIPFLLTHGPNGRDTCQMMNERLRQQFKLVESKK